MRTCVAVCVCVNEEITQIAFCFVSRCMLVSTLLHRLQGNKYVFAILKICFKKNIPTGLFKVSYSKGYHSSNVDCCFSDDHGFSPLHWACREGRSGVVDMLIMRGARINVMNRGDDTPLHLAASHGHRDIVAKVHTHTLRHTAGPAGACVV